MTESLKEEISLQNTICSKAILSKITDLNILHDTQDVPVLITYHRHILRFRSK